MIETIEMSERISFFEIVDEICCKKMLMFFPIIWSSILQNFGSKILEMSKNPSHYFFKALLVASFYYPLLKSPWDFYLLFLPESSPPWIKALIELTKFSSISNILHDSEDCKSFAFCTAWRNYGTFFKHSDISRGFAYWAYFLDCPLSTFSIWELEIFSIAINWNSEF